MPAENKKTAGKRYYLLFGVGILLALVLILASENSTRAGGVTVGANSGNAKEKEERKVTCLLSELEGVQDVSVMLKTDGEDRVIGVAVICRDGDNPELQEKIIRLLRALYGIGAHQIGVSG